MSCYSEYAYRVTGILDRLDLIDGDARIDAAVRLVKIGGY